MNINIQLFACPWIKYETIPHLDFTIHTVCEKLNCLRMSYNTNVLP